MFLLQGEPGLKLVERTAEILPADENMLKTLSPLPSEIEKAIEETKGIQTEGYFIYINGKSFRRYRKCGNCKGKIYILKIDFFCGLNMFFII